MTHPTLHVAASARRSSALTVTVEATAKADLAHVWDVFVPIDLAVVFPCAKGPIPAVTGTSGQTGRWDVVGRSRVVHLSDGRHVREEITASEPSDGRAPQDGSASFAYRVDGFTGPFGLLAREARGSWTFTQIAPGQTRIVWTYEFEPTGFLGSLPLRVIAPTFWRAYMRDGLANIVRRVKAA
ncbi:MAG: SRPBCC family protein, partial [Pararhodobacter sp.]